MFTLKGSPASYTPESILQLLENSSIFLNSRVLMENALFFLTNLFFRTINNYDNDEDEKNDSNNEFQPVSSDLIIAMMSRKNYKVILEELEKLNIIEINHSYKTGEYNKGYRINSELLIDKPKLRKFEMMITKKKFKRLDDYYRARVANDFPYTLQMINSIRDKIFVDFEKANEFIQSSDYPDKKKRHYLKKVRAIQLRYTWNFKVAKSNQRLYHGFTSFPKDLRQFLYTYNETGKKDFSKIEIDGCNTQPVMICIEMRNTGAIPDSDFEELCFNGNLYDSIAIGLGVERNDVKERFMDTLLFTPNNSERVLSFKNPNELNLARKTFGLYMKDHFPITWNWLLDTKRKYSESVINPENKDNPGGSELAKRIQRMEANLWIHEFLKTLPEELIYFTIHDSIMIFKPTPEIIMKCSDKLLETGRRIYGFDIPVKVKNILKF